MNYSRNDSVINQSNLFFFSRKTAGIGVRVFKPSTTKNAGDVVAINKLAMLSIILHSKDDSSIYIDGRCLGPHVAQAGGEKSIRT